MPTTQTRLTTPPKFCRGGERGQSPWNRLTTPPRYFYVCARACVRACVRVPGCVRVSVERGGGGSKSLSTREIYFEEFVHP